jgi:phosphopantothenoylcysteine decarboxylase/phosphopantothenate--cysteine ligase
MLITAGPTREPLDAVRFISNRSSGAIGLALAQAATQAGHTVTLLLGPGPRDSDVPADCRTHRFESSAELKQLLEAHFNDHEVLIMAAAVSDYRPAEVSEGKPPRPLNDEPWTIRLQPTPDLVALMAARKKSHQRIVAFALEEAANLETRAMAKLERKGVDAIVANPLGTMESDAITAVWLTADATRRDAPGRMNKQAFAAWLMKKIATDL